MSELERDLVDTLERHATEAPDAHGLAAAARGRASHRRRTRMAGAAVAVVLAVGIPTAVAAWPTPEEPVAPTVQDPEVASDDSAPNGYHWESWHDVTLQVPNTWVYGNLSQWCAAGSPHDGEAPRVERPGGASTMVACTPAWTYGVQLAPSNGETTQWPVARQDSEAWPLGAYVGRRAVGGVLVTVVARKSTVAQAVLDSAQPIDDYDPYGCAETLGRDAVAPADGMNVCRYDEKGRLVQSELLRGEQVEAAEAELRDSAAGFERRCTTTPVEVVRMTSGSVSAGLGIGGCNYLTVDDSDRILGADVLYWALSPGFTGDVTGLPLPPQLRLE